MAVKNGITAGILVGAVDVLIFQHFVPTHADIRRVEPYNVDIESSERKALYAATVFTLLVAGLARSAEVFAIGGLTIIAIDFTLKHANAVNPTSGKVEGMQSNATSTAFPLPDYGA
jgi:hypothetical protein